MDIQTTQFYNRNATALTNRYETADVSKMHQQLLEIYGDRFPKLLEIGCGSGRDAAFMVSNGYDVTAVDGSQAMITEANKLHPELNGRLSVIELPHDLHMLQGHYDGVYSIATLMHLSKIELLPVMMKIVELLREGGLLFFSISIERDDTNDIGYDEKGRYFNKMTKTQWMQMCNTCNLKCIQISESDDGLGRGGITWLTIVAEKFTAE